MFMLFTLTILVVSPESWFAGSSRILLFLIVKYQWKEAFIWQKQAKSKINNWSSIVLNKLPYFVFGGLPNQSICIYNREEAKNTENNFTNFRKRCTTEVGWNKQTVIKWIIVLLVIFSPCHNVTFSTGNGLSSQCRTFFQMVDQQYCHVLAREWRWAQKAPPMILGIIVTNISGQDNNYASDEKSLQKAPNLLVNKSLERHNLTLF